MSGSINSRPWAVAVFACREDLATLSECVAALVAACQVGNKGAVIDIVINGNPQLGRTADALVEMSTGEVDVKVRSITLGDKANAWNEYVHTFWPGAETTFFVDGYVKVRPDAFALLDAAIAAGPSYLAATGVPSVGRTAESLRRQMSAGGGMHGNMHAIGKKAMTTYRHNHVRLPVGLYRTDSLIGAIMMFQFDPSQFKWDSSVVKVHPDATWGLINQPRFGPALIKSFWKRKLRQSQGQLENLAVHEHLAIRRQTPQTLPATARQLVLGWSERHPSHVRKLAVKNFFILHAMYHFKNRALTV